MDNFKTTIEAFNRLASAYQDKFMELDLYNDTYDAFCSLVQKQGARIFEIGCGPGNITRYILSKRPDFKVEAIDIAPNMVQLAKGNNPAASFRVMDCREIDTLADKFDAVIGGFCLPYLSKEDSVKLIKDTASLLHHGGIFYFSTIEDAYNKSGFETSGNGQNKLFIYYHQEDYLREMLRENAFTVVDLIRKSYPKADGTSSTHMIFLTRKE